MLAVGRVTTVLEVGHDGGLGDVREDAAGADLRQPESRLAAQGPPVFPLAAKQPTTS